MLRATTACTFSTSQLPTVVRTWCVLYILTSKCASRHNGVHFFDVSTSKSAPRPRFFVPFHFSNFSFLISPDVSAPAALASLLFDPPEPQNIEKTQFRDFPTFSHTCIFFLLIFSLLTFLPSDSAPVWLFAPLLFHLSILSEA